MSPAELESRIRNEIPALGSAAFSIAAVEPLRVRVSARLNDHLNHKGTAFGGSLYQVALVACYGLFLQLLEEGGCPTRDFVIAEGRMRYRAPVPADFTAATEVDAAELRAFLEELRHRGQASLPMRAMVLCQGSRCADFEARFKAFYPARSAPA